MTTAGLVCLLVLSFSGVWAWRFLAPAPPPSFAQVQKQYRQSDALLLDRHGTVLHQLRINARGRRRDWTRLEEVSPALMNAVIRSEDQRFYQHHGVDWRALSTVGIKGLWGESWRGASTITMQLASRLDPKLEPRLTRRTMLQKGLQIRAALELEKRWNKAEILETYLNLVTFRGELQGITAASLGLFDKRPHGLTPLEAVILASLIRAPNAEPGEVSNRGVRLAGSLKWEMAPGMIEDKVREILLRPYRVPLDAAWAPHLARQLLKLRPDGNDSPLQVSCTLDAELQRFAYETLHQHLTDVRSRNVNDGAVLVVDNPSGEVLAYVGSVGDLSSAWQVDGIQAQRQAGSILKPFLYGLAFDRRLLTASSLLQDSPLEMGMLNGIYRPENYDRQFRGLVTARVALASSLNIPAVRTLNLVGVRGFVDQLALLGFRDLKESDYYGPSLALGAVDITLWDLVNAYRALANRGVWQPLRVAGGESRDTIFRGRNQDGGAGASTIAEQVGVGYCRKVLSPEAAFILADILSDRESRSMTFSLESPLATRFWTAVKTGTSKDMRDNWCVGFSNRFTVGVWVGNFSGEPMWNVMGITGAAPVWVDIMNRLHHQRPSLPPVAPTRLQAHETEFPDLGVTRREWYLLGADVAVSRAALAGVAAGIMSPANGEVMAWDPDIPPDQQRVFFEARPHSGQMYWELDGRRLGGAEATLMWAPQPGKHSLKLLGQSGETLDAIQFVVRGMQNSEGQSQRPTEGN